MLNMPTYMLNMLNFYHKKKCRKREIDDRNIGIWYGGCILDLGPDHVQVFWKHKCFGIISQLKTRPLIG